MPAPEIDDRYQPAVLWEAVGYDRYGRPTVSDAPVEVMVRAIKTGTLKSDEMTVIFDREVAAGSVLKLGRLADLEPGSDLSEDDEALMEVMTLSQTPDGQARNWRREARLRFYKQHLPNYQPERT